MVEGFLILMTFTFVFGSIWAALVAGGKTMHLRPKHFLPSRKPKAIVPVKTLAEAHAEDHKFWQEEFNLLLRANCVHSYAGTGSSPKYYTCRDCGYEEPWEWQVGCTCRCETVSTPAGKQWKVLTSRYGNCKWHGVDYENFGKYSNRQNKPFLSVERLAAQRDYARALERKKTY